MKQFSQPQVQSISLEEIQQYRKEIEALPPSNNRHFNLLEQKGIVRFEEYLGNRTMYVCAPVEYKRYDEIRDRVEKYDWAKLQETFAEFPEEEVAWRNKLNQWLADTKKVLMTLNRQKKVAYTE